MNKKEDAKKIAEVEKLCRELKVSFPAELASRIRQKEIGKTMPPKKEVAAMIKETKSLIKGHTYKIEFPEFGIVLQVYLFWEDDKETNLSVIKFWPMDKYKNTYTESIDLIIRKMDYENTALSYLEGRWGEKNIKATKEFKDFNNRIKTVCEKSDRWEKEYEDFDWSNDILEPAGG